jgi:hypothetical protein
MYKIRIDSHITEKRAPTDESIRLAKEYEEKIIKSIIADGVCNLQINQISWTIRDDGHKYTIYVIFFIDERKQNIEIDIYRKDIKYNNIFNGMDQTTYIVDRIINAISQHCSRVIMHNMILQGFSTSIEEMIK